MTTGSPDAFRDLGTLGVEEEFFLVDDAGLPAPGSDTLVYEAEPPELLDGRIDHELFKFVVETQTPRMDGPAEAADVVTDVRDALVEYAAEHGYGVSTAGLHPGAVWREHEHAEKPRYRSQLDRIQYPQHRNTTAGLHVHVGVDDPDKAVWVANEIQWYLPVLLALSANSPFWNRHDTGLASARSTVFENLPNTGMPTAFDSYAAFARFEKALLDGGAIEDRGEIWWDVRPHSAHGTVEVRSPDAQHDPAVSLALIEYTHALVMDLCERYEDGEDGTDVRRELLDHNKWRAVRHGHDASLLAPDGSEVRTLGEVVDAECDRLGVRGIRDVYDAESGAAFQRRVHATEGADALYDAIRL